MTITTNVQIVPGWTLCTVCSRVLISTPGNPPGPNEGEYVIATDKGVYHEKCAPKRRSR